MNRIAPALVLASLSLVGCDDSKPASTAPAADAGAAPAAAGSAAKAPNAKAAGTSKSPPTKPVD